MSLKIFVTKYIAQLKALNPKYDKIFELSSEKNPVIYQDKENLRLSFAAIADTHLPNRESASLNLNNFFLDAEKSGAEYDALLMAGDIADWGLTSEYKRVFDVMDNQKSVPHIFLTLGNHDVRTFFKRNLNLVMSKVEEMKVKV